MKNWIENSNDDRITVQVETKKGRETGKVRYIFADGHIEIKSYKPKSTPKRSRKYPPIFFLCGGFLCGILLQALTNVLKLN